MALNAIESMIGNLLMTVFGSGNAGGFAVVGIMLLIFALITFFILRVPFELGLVITIPMLFLASANGFIPGWVGVVAALVCGFIIYMAITRISHR